MALDKLGTTVSLIPWGLRVVGKGALPTETGVYPVERRIIRSLTAKMRKGRKSLNPWGNISEEFLEERPPKLTKSMG
jgi:hypothetical protein